MSAVHKFTEIDQYLAANKLNISTKFSDFLIYDWESVNWDTCLDDLPYRSHYFEVLLEEDAGCSLAVDQFNFTSVPGQYSLFFISPYRLQSCQNSEEPIPHKGFSILFKPTFLHLHPSNTQFIRDFPFFDHANSPKISLPADHAADIVDLFHKIKYEYDNPHIVSRDIIKSYLHILMLKGKLLYDHQIQPTIGNSREQEIYNEFISRVQQRYRELDAVSDYANQMHISPKHLSETVKNISGLPALRVIHNARIHHAKSLLRQTSMTVSEIAHELNFANPDYFSIFFKRLVGQSPLTFRKS